MIDHFWSAGAVAELGTGGVDGARWPWHCDPHGRLTATWVTHTQRACLSGTGWDELHTSTKSFERPSCSRAAGGTRTQSRPDQSQFARPVLMTHSSQSEILALHTNSHALELVKSLKLNLLLAHVTIGQSQVSPFPNCFVNECQWSGKQKSSHTRTEDEYIRIGSPMSFHYEELKPFIPLQISVYGNGNRLKVTSINSDGLCNPVFVAMHTE